MVFYLYIYMGLTLFAYLLGGLPWVLSIVTSFFRFLKKGFHHFSIFSSFFFWCRRTSDGLSTNNTTNNTTLPSQIHKKKLLTTRRKGWTTTTRHHRQHVSSWTTRFFKSYNKKSCPPTQQTTFLLQLSDFVTSFSLLLLPILKDFFFDLSRNVLFLLLISYITVFSSVAFLYFLVHPSEYWWLLPYLAVFIFDPSRKEGLYRWDAARNWTIWKFLSNYFPCTVVIDQDQHQHQHQHPTTSTIHPNHHAVWEDEEGAAEITTTDHHYSTTTTFRDRFPNRPYIFGLHPHGVFCHSAFFNFVTDSTRQISRYFPHVNMYFGSIKLTVCHPFHGALLCWLGGVEVSKEILPKLLSRRFRTPPNDPPSFSSSSSSPPNNYLDTNPSNTADHDHDNTSSSAAAGGGGGVIRRTTAASTYKTFFATAYSNVSWLFNHFLLFLYRCLLPFQSPSPNRHVCTSSPFIPPNTVIVPGIVIAIGGIREFLHTGMSTDPHLISGHRSGIFRIALQTGAKLVPAFGFGEVQLYSIRPHVLCWLRNMYAKYGKMVIMLFYHFCYYGRGLMETLLRPGDSADGNEEEEITLHGDSETDDDDDGDDETTSDSEITSEQPKITTTNNKNTIRSFLGSVAFWLRVAMSKFLIFLSIVARYPGPVLPRRIPLRCVVSGCPIVCRRIEEPTEEQVDALKAEYGRRLRSLYDKHKKQCNRKVKRDKSG